MKNYDSNNKSKINIRGIHDEFATNKVRKFAKKYGLKTHLRTCPSPSIYMVRNFFQNYAHYDFASLAKNEVCKFSKKTVLKIHLCIQVRNFFAKLM